MEEVKLNDIGLHKITETHPVMTPEQFDALKNDIKINGQLQPAIVYRGKIVDGRHRYRALTELGAETIKINRLQNNLKLEEVTNLVNSTEMRRHQSPTQLAIKGYRLYKLGNLTQKDIPSRVGCSLTNLKAVIALESFGRVDIIELLESGGKMNVSRDGRFSKMTDSLLAIVGFIKEEVARLDALQIEAAEQEEQVERKVSKEEVMQLQAVELLTSTWSVELKKILIAKLYQGM